MLMAHVLWFKIVVHLGFDIIMILVNFTLGLTWVGLQAFDLAELSALTSGALDLFDSWLTI